MKKLILINPLSCKKIVIKNNVITEIKLKRPYKGKNKPVVIEFETIKKD